MIMTIYKRALAVLMKKPLKLWGISLLSTVLTGVLVSLCGFAIPAVGIAVSLLLSTSMLMVYLHGYRGEEVQVLQLFDCFKDWATIKRVVLGLAWMNLWIFLWSLIPIVGPIFALIRTYEYRLTPYILITEPEVALTDAIKVSKERTEGYKLQMFGADILVGLIIAGAYIVLGILCAIPVIQILAVLAMAVLLIAIPILLPLFMGLVQAAFYEEISNPTIPVIRVGAAPTQAQSGQYGFCTQCGAPFVSADATFCTQCGKSKE